jgi:hypothetical protein
MIFFNRNAWADFTQALTHRHKFSSEHGYLTVPGGPTLLRCKCGFPEWVGLGETGTIQVR